MSSAYVSNGRPWSMATHGSHIVNGVQLVPGAPGFNAQAAAPWHRQIARTDSQLASAMGAGGGGAFAGGSGGNSFARSNPFEYNQRNPYLDEMSQVTRQQVNENLMRQMLPAIGSQAIAAGGFGGSRQGVVEANALRDANAQLSNALTGMRFGDYNQQLARQLQLRQMDQSFDLGMLNSDRGFFTQQRGQDLQQLGLGASLLGQGTGGLMGQGQGLFGVGLTTQQAPWQVVNNAAGATSPFTGFGNTTTTGGGNNPWGGMLGGALAGAQFGQLFR